MKKILSGLFLLAFGIAGCSSDSLEAIKALGTRDFSADAWSSASQKDRGEMVFSLLDTYEITTMKVEEIKALLGESTAYYDYDEFPAYLVGPETIQSEYGNGYVLAFPFDRRTGLISHYVISPKPATNSD